jgi:glucokinase
VNGINRFVGIDLGGSSVKAVVVDAVGALIADATVPFVDRNGEWANAAADLLSRLERDFGPMRGVGLSAPGLASSDRRSIAHLPGKLQGIEGFDWTDRFRSSTPVPVLNDAHAALMGELWVGAARGLANVAMFTLGTGVGGAAMVDGRLLRGNIGRAGHLGHLSLDFNGPLDDTGAPGSLELELGNKTIRARSKGRFPTTHALITACRQGDGEALQIWLRSVRAFAAAIASVVNILDPEAIIIGGGIARAGATLFEPLKSELDRFEWRPGGSAVRLLPAQLGDLAGAYGSAYQASLAAE